MATSRPVPVPAPDLTPRSAKPQPRRRLREVVPGIHLGSWPPGPKNSLTDVPGVLAHTTTIRSNDGSVNTGVTVILPRRDWIQNASHAGIFRFNGSGEMTGSHWLEETGLLSSPIVITNTFSVGDAYRGIYDFAINEHIQDGELSGLILPVVAETYDGWLNDVTKFAVTPRHVVETIRNASDAPVPEGNVGGGTGMMCHGFKGGTGSSSRVIPGLLPGDGNNKEKTTFTVAALVQANYGKMHHLHVAGVPVGRIIVEEKQKQAADEAEATAVAAAEVAAREERKDGSIIVILATDAPLHPTQLQRLAKRATVGLARVGGHGHNSSGDIFLAFSTANAVKTDYRGTIETRAIDPYIAETEKFASVNDHSTNALFEAAADATEEAIYNALCMAETMVGLKGRRVEALDLEKLRGIMERYMVKS